MSPGTAVSCWGALALLLLAACGSTRVYEGDELPAGTVVVIDEWSSAWDSRQTAVLAVDGRSVERGFGADEWEIAPGPHEIVAQASRPLASLLLPAIFGDHCRLRFTAEPGVTYELRTEYSDLHPPLNLQLIDTRTDEVVADNEPDRAEDCLSAEVELPGAGWTPAMYSTNHDQSVVVLVPAGRTLKDSDERVEVRCHGSPAGAPDVDDVMSQLWEEWKDVVDEPDSSVVARDSSATPGLVFVLRGERDDEYHTALVVLRTHGALVHALVYDRQTPDLPKADMTTWRERFARARLFEPAAR
jgi:hypothetical protein